MKQLSTKERIRTEALHLFAQYGYDAISVAQIAKAVGIQAPSLYKHYASKEDIFLAIIKEMEKRYAQHAAGMQINGSDARKTESCIPKLRMTSLSIWACICFLIFFTMRMRAAFAK